MLPGVVGSVGAVPGLDVIQTDTRTTAATSHSNVNFGPEWAGSWVVVLAFHGNTASNPGNTPTCTAGGSAATRITAASTGDGSGTACGSAIFTAQPTGASGTVSVSWGGLSTVIVVLRVVGYNLASAYSADGASSPDASSNMSVDIPNGGALIGCEIANNTTATSWTSLTKRDEQTVFTSKSISLGWDLPLAPQVGRAVSFSPYSATQGATSGRCASFSPV